jgi:hypothetical protein
MSKKNEMLSQALESNEVRADAAAKARSGVSAMHALGVGLLLAGTAAGAFAGTLSVSEEVELAASPAQTWAVIQDFRRWQTWHPAFAATEIARGAGNEAGAVRVLATRDGAKFTEELLSHDDVALSYQYRILESPLPISDYVSTIQVTSSRTGSRVTWSSTFNVSPGASPEEIKKTIAGVYRAGLDNLKGSAHQ